MENDKKDCRNVETSMYYAGCRMDMNPLMKILLVLALKAVALSSKNNPMFSEQNAC